MSKTIIQELATNAAMLLLLCFLYVQILRRWEGRSLAGQILNGVLFGGFAICVMFFPLYLLPGVIFDTRSVVISVGGLFGGPLVGAITFVMAGAFRAWLGGDGALMGVLVSLFSAALGAAYYYWQRSNPKALKAPYLYGFGVAVHAVMLGCTLALPGGMTWRVLSDIALPVMLVYPPASLVLCLLIVDRQSRLASEKRLRDSEERLRQIIDNTQAGYFSIDAQGRFQHVNQAWLDLHGYQSAEEVVGCHFSMTQVESGLESAQATVEQLLGGKEILAGEFSRRRKDGSVGYHNFSARPVAKDGIIVGLEGFLIDTTQIRQVQKDYQTLFNEMLDAFALHEIICDQSGRPVDYRFLTVNPAFERMTGLKAVDLLGKTVTEALPGIERHWIETYGRVALTGEPVFFENYARDLQRHFEVRVFRTAPRQFACIFNDITERKRSEEAQSTSLIRQRLAMDLAKLVIWEYDVEADLFTFNDQFYALYGTKASEQGGYQMSSQEYAKRFLPPEDAPFVGDAVEKAITTRDPNFLCQLEHRIIRADGRERFVRVRFAVVKDETGHTIRTYGANQDITDQMRAEEEKAKTDAQLRQAQKMEAIGTLAGGIAHDFNNILGVVIGYSEMALEAAKDKLDPAPDINNILQAGERARDLVKQIITFSRKVEVELKPLNLNTEVNRVAELLSRTIPKMITIETLLDQDLKPVLANANQFEQVLLNLGSNAQHAMPGGGRLIMETCNVTLDHEYCMQHLEVMPGDYVLLQVSDTGMGMNQQTREHIFEPFFTTKEVGKGTGLGLSTVYGIVKGLGGQITCYSEPGLGTTFKIHLPVYQHEASSFIEGPQQTQESLGGKETILLVDDEDALRDLGALTLSKAGYSVLTAKSGEKALEIYQAQSQTIGLVVMDLGMPGMGGYRALKAILELNPQAKVMIASGYAANGGVKEALQSGAAGYVAKPFKKAELLTTVRTVLDKK